MAEFLHFSRDSRLYMEKDGYLWLIPVLDGFSFSQATNASEITLNEMEDATGRSRRGRKMFTDSLSPAEFSFSTYIRPFKSTGLSSGSLDGLTHNATAALNKAGKASSTQNAHCAVEEALWACMAGQNGYTGTTGVWQARSTAAPATYQGVTGIVGGAISSVEVGGLVEDNGGTAGTKTFTVSASGLGDSTTGASTNSTTGANAVIQVTLTSDGSGGGTHDMDVTAVVTERGIGWKDGETITILGSALGGVDGSSPNDNVVITVRSKSLVRTSTSSLDINFYDSNRSALGTFNLYFVLSDRTDGRLVYKVKDAVLNEASIDFDIDGIATVNWSGFAGQIVEVGEDATGSVSAGKYQVATSAPTPAAENALWFDSDDKDALYISRGTSTGSWWHHIDEGSADTGNFIRNRLTQLTLAPESTFRSGTTFTDSGDGSTQYETSYSVALTGGNVTISNNITFLTPEELGVVNQPIEHVTGTRTVTGSATCYLGSSDAAGNRSKNLFADLVADNTTVINKFAITLDVGGSAGTPRFTLNLPTAHLEVPSHSIEDVISLETNFHGLGTTVGEGDEITLQYVGK